jgi:hypothetical protein
MEKDENKKASQAPSETSTEESEQEPAESEETAEGTDSEVEKTQDPDVDKRRLQAALREARAKLRTEKEKRFQAEALAQNQAEKPSQPLDSPDEIQRRFLTAEARASVAYLMMKQPMIKDYLQEVEEVMDKTGKTAEDSWTEVKAALFDKVYSMEDSGSQEPKPNTIKPSAVPEETPKKTTGSILKDIQKGYREVEPELKESLRRYGG